MMQRWWWRALLVLALWVPAAAEAQVGGVLRPGDAIRLNVWNDPELTGTFAVDERGIVVLPKLGPRVVGGKPGVQVRDAIAAEFAASLPNPSIEVTVMHRVLVRGQVRQPGSFLLTPYEATLGHALSYAQGPTPEARLDRVLLVRGDSSRMVRYSPETRLAAVRLESGDELVVPARSWLFRNPALVPALISGAFSVLITAVLVGAQ